MLVIARGERQEVWIKHAGEWLNLKVLETTNSRVKLGFTGDGFIITRMTPDQWESYTKDQEQKKRESVEGASEASGWA